jgi:hypothetical protein
LFHPEGEPGISVPGGLKNDGAVALVQIGNREQNDAKGEEGNEPVERLKEGKIIGLS